jgi:hypothetical protein
MSVFGSPCKPKTRVVADKPPPVPYVGEPGHAYKKGVFVKGVTLSGSHQYLLATNGTAKGIPLVDSPCNDVPYQAPTKAAYEIEIPREDRSIRLKTELPNTINLQRGSFSSSSSLSSTKSWSSWSKFSSFASFSAASSALAATLVSYSSSTSPAAASVSVEHQLAAASSTRERLFAVHSATQRILSQSGFHAIANSRTLRRLGNLLSIVDSLSPLTARSQKLQTTPALLGDVGGSNINKKLSFTGTQEKIDGDTRKEDEAAEGIIIGSAESPSVRSENSSTVDRMLPGKRKSDGKSRLGSTSPPEKNVKAAVSLMQRSTISSSGKKTVASSSDVAKHLPKSDNTLFRKNPQVVRVEETNEAEISAAIEDSRSHSSRSSSSSVELGFEATSDASNVNSSKRQQAPSVVSESSVIVGSTIPSSSSVPSSVVSHVAKEAVYAASQRPSISKLNRSMVLASQRSSSPGESAAVAAMLHPSSSRSDVSSRHSAGYELAAHIGAQQQQQLTSSTTEPASSAAASASMLSQRQVSLKPRNPSPIAVISGESVGRTQSSPTSTSGRRKVSLPTSPPHTSTSGSVTTAVAITTTPPAGSPSKSLLRSPVPMAASSERLATLKQKMLKHSREAGGGGAATDNSETRSPAAASSTAMPVVPLGGKTIASPSDAASSLSPLEKLSLSRDGLQQPQRKMVFKSKAVHL